MNIIYFDCFSGISGDMALGAFVDIGVPVEALEAEMRKLPLENWSIESRKERRGAVEGTRIIISAEHQPHRHFGDIKNILNESGLEQVVKEKSLSIFERIAQAEGRVHGVPPMDVHFHEVGAVDSILDIAGTVFCLEYLNVGKVYSSPVPMPRGFIKTQHGTIPLPAPATALLLSGVPVYGSTLDRELVTPTGAAIISTMAESFGPIPAMTLVSTGYGVGTNPAHDPPNLLRVFYGKDQASLRTRDLLMIETNIDDMNPEIYNYVLDKLFAQGALDVSLIPVQMKKNRPGVLLRVLVEPALEREVTELLLCETSTLGVRVQEVRRIEVPREERTIETGFGPCRVKWVMLPNGKERLIPEYEECRRIAEKSGTPLVEVYRGILLSTEARPE